MSSVSRRSKNTLFDLHRRAAHETVVFETEFLRFRPLAPKPQPLSFYGIVGELEQVEGDAHGEWNWRHSGV